MITREQLQQMLEDITPAIAEYRQQINGTEGDDDDYERILGEMQVNNGARLERFWGLSQDGVLSLTAFSGELMSQTREYFPQNSQESKK